MYASIFVMMIETALMSVEASRVIALRMQVFANGGAEAWHEADLMIHEKTLAFNKALDDLRNGSSQSSVRSDIRAVVQANIRRLVVRA